MARMIAIGGGFPNQRTDLSYAYIGASVDKRARMVVLPTPCEGTDFYDSCISHVKKNFGYGGLGMHIDVIHLGRGAKTSIQINDISNRIIDADILYVTGGDPMTALETWDRLELIPALKHFFNTVGRVYTGISAGTILPFSWFLSDHPVMRNEEPLRAIALKGLEIYPGQRLVTVHYDVEEWHMKEYIKKETGSTSREALCLDDCVGFEINEESEIRFWTENPEKKAYITGWKDGKYFERPILPELSRTPWLAKFIPLEQVFD